MKRDTVTLLGASRISLFEVCYTHLLSILHLLITLLYIGGENIAPREIEERLVQHPSVGQAAVVGLTDAKYGEVVGAFLQQRVSQNRPSTASLQDFVRKTLGWHKAPSHIFWLGENEDFPTTGNGKIKKHVLKTQGDEVIKNRARLSKL